MWKLSQRFILFAENHGFKRDLTLKLCSLLLAITIVQYIAHKNISGKYFFCQAGKNDRFCQETQISAKKTARFFSIL